MTHGDGPDKMTVDTPHNQIAGVVVLFEPPESVIDNIRTYVTSLNTLYVIDNTPNPDRAVVEQIANVGQLRYVWLGENKGIAEALNVGAELAQAEGHALLLTMDQDSRALPGMVEELARCIAIEPNVGMASAALASLGEAGTGQYRTDFTITSGSLLRLDAWKHVGPFFDELFIDLVDTEYCLRLRRHGYTVMKSREAIILHTIGAPSSRRWFLLGKVTVSNHSAVRRYYLWRNALHLRDVYGRDLPEWFRATGRTIELLLILLYENDRANKLRMILRGYRDHRLGLLGRYPDRLVDARHHLSELSQTDRIAPKGSFAERS